MLLPFTPPALPLPLGTKMKWQCAVIGDSEWFAYCWYLFGKMSAWVDVWNRDNMASKQRRAAFKEGSIVSGVQQAKCSAELVPMQPNKSTEYSMQVLSYSASSMLGDTTASDFVYKKGVGGLLALRPTRPQKNLTQNLAEGKSSLNQRPLCGTHPEPPPFGINSL